MFMNKNNIENNVSGKCEKIVLPCARMALKVAGLPPLPTVPPFPWKNVRSMSCFTATLAC